MPEYTGRLTPDDLAVINEWFRDNWTRNLNCPISNHRNWIIADYLAATPISSPWGSIITGGATYPQVMVFCGNCGYTLYFSAAMIGLVTQR